LPEGCRPTTTLRSQPRFSVSDHSVRDLQLLELPDPTYQASSFAIELRAHNPSGRAGRGPRAPVSFRPLHGKQRYVPFALPTRMLPAGYWGPGRQSPTPLTLRIASSRWEGRSNRWDFRLARSSAGTTERYDRPDHVRSPPLGIVETSHGPCLATLAGYRGGDHLRL